MTGPNLDRITPSQTVHIPPPEKPTVRKLTSRQVGVVGTVISDLILAQVALALGGITIVGVKPFAFLTTWGEQIQKKAADAYNKALASEAVSNSSDANTAIAIGQSYSTQTGLQTTWNSLWEANTGQTAAANKTITDVKQAQVTVATSAQVGATGATGNAKSIQDTWNEIYYASGGTGSGNVTLTTASGALADVADTAVTGASGATANAKSIQDTWDTIYIASGGTGPSTNKSLNDAKTALSGVTDDAATGREYSQETVDAIYNVTYGTNTSGRPVTDVVPALDAWQTEGAEQYKSGSNAMLSPDFEETIIPRLTIGGASLQHGYSNGTTEPARSGVRSYKWTQLNTDCGLYFAPTRLSNRLTVRAPATATTGDWFYVEAWLYKPSSSTGTIRFGAHWYNSAANNRVNDWEELALSSVTLNTWTKFSRYCQVASGRDQGEFFIQANQGTTVGAVFYVDDVVVREVTDAKEAAAAAAAAQTAADEAVVYVDETQKAGTNLVLTPDFEVTTQTRLHVGSPTNPVVGVVTTGTGYSTTQKRSGSYSYRWQQPASSNTGVFLAPTQTTPAVKASPGDRFEVEVWVFAPSSNSIASGAIRLGVEWLSNGNALSPAVENYTEWTLAASNTAGTLGRNSWKQLTFTSPACPSTANSVRFQVYATAATPTNNVFFIDDAVVREVTLPQNTADAIVKGGGGGGTPTGATPADVEAATSGQSTTLGDLNTKVTDLITENTQNALAGNAFYKDFSTASTFTALGFNTVVVGTPSGGNGTGTMVISNGRAAWSGSGLDRTRAYTIYTAANHTSDYQKVGAVFTTALPYQTTTGGTFGGNFLIARAITETYGGIIPTSCVYAKFFYPDLVSGLLQQARVQLWYRNGGVETQVKQESFTYTVGATYWLEAGQRAATLTSTTDRTFTVYKDGAVILTWTDNILSPVTAMGSSNRRCGFGMEPGADALFRYDPAQLGSWTAFDNVPATILGSGFRATYSTAGTQAVTAATGSGTPTLLGSTNAFIQDYKSADITYSQTTQTVTVSVTGWYSVSVGLRFSTSVANTAAAIFVNGVCQAVGGTSSTIQGSVSTTLFLKKDDTVAPGYKNDGTAARSLAGGTAFDNYFAVAFLNNVKPVQP